MNHTVEVETYGSHGKFALTLPHPSNATQLRDAVRKQLGLKPASLALFGLSLGPLGHPNQMLLDSDTVPVGGSVNFQRWNFDTEKEIKLVRSDDVALHLLYGEAKFRLDSEVLTPRADQRRELESLSDPSFPTERQFLEMAQKVDNYQSYSADGCRLESRLQHDGVEIAAGVSVTCTVGVDHLSLWTRGSEAVWPWEHVKRWNTPTKRTVKFEVCNKQQNAPILEWVVMTTSQAYFLAQTASQNCDLLKAKQDAASNPHPPGRNPLLPGRHYDPLKEFVNKELFGVMRFSSIKQQ